MEDKEDSEEQDVTDMEEMAREEEYGELWTEAGRAMPWGLTGVLGAISRRSSVEVATSTEWRCKNRWARASYGLIRFRGLYSSIRRTKSSKRKYELVGRNTLPMATRIFRGWARSQRHKVYTCS